MQLLLLSYTIQPNQAASWDTELWLNIEKDAFQEVEVETITAEDKGNTPKTNINASNSKLGWQFPFVRLETKHSHLIPQLFPSGPAGLAFGLELALWQTGKQRLSKILQS